jgi:hypothetical protein
MTNITVTITGEGRAIGKTQLAEHMREALRGWSPKGIERPNVVVVDAGYRIPINFHASEAPPAKKPSKKLKHALAKIEDAGRVYNIDGAVLDCIAKSWDGADAERSGFAQEMAMQYGFTIIDDNAEIYGVTAERLADMMSVLGFRTRAEREAAEGARLPREWFDQIVEGAQQMIDSAWERFEKAAVLRPSGKLDTNAKHHFAVEIGRAANNGAKVASSVPKPGSYATGGVVGSGESDFAVKVRKGYAGLHRVLVEALDQAQGGKGAERHNLGGDVPFERQRMQTVSELIGSVDGMTYQACKKITEGVKLPTLERQERELLGAINYIAGMIIFLRKQAAEKGAADPFDDEPQQPIVIKVNATGTTTVAQATAQVRDALRKPVDPTRPHAGIPGME